MASCQDTEEDTRPLLHLSIEFRNQHDIHYSSFGPAIARGALIHLGQWPSHIFMAFIKICLVVTAFIVFALVVFSSLSKDIKSNYRSPRSTGTEEYPNIYFVGDTNQVWSREDLCNVESSARDYPELTVYLINLPIQRSLHFLDGVNVPKSQSFGFALEIVTALTSKYKNIRSIDTNDRIFFKNSMLEKFYDKFDGSVLAIAVRSHLLWTHFGVALSPSKVNQLNNLKTYLHKQRRTGTSVKKAAISLDGSIQASPMTCHAFYGHLLRMIISKPLDPGFMKKAFESFCPRFIECSGVEIFKNVSKSISSELSCPTVLTWKQLQAKF